MTPAILLRAVQELEPNPGLLVSARDIMDWCRRHQIDYGPPSNVHFWNADLKEADGQHRLLKFKSAPTRTGANFFARRIQAPPAPSPASSHPGRAEARLKGLVECEWRSPWDWKNAKVPW